MKRGLGKGLSALIGENLIMDEINPDGLSRILLENIFANPKQPRVIFNQAELEELVASIKENGILQPILVKPIDDGKYEIIAGERRWRAAKMLGLEEIPAIIKDIEAHKALELALIENIQRENLDPLEEAEAYQRLIEEHQYTQEKMAELMSKSRSHIANLLRLLNLSDRIKTELREGNISLGHAKLLINHPNADEAITAILDRKYNVRQTEQFLKTARMPSTKVKRSSRSGDNSSSIKPDDILAIEEFISENINMPVEIAYCDGIGKISIHFEGMEEFDKLVKKLTNSIV